MTNKCTMISQIITLLHVSTISCHHQGACNQYLAKLLARYWLLWPTNAQLFHKLSDCYMFRQYRVIIRGLVINTLPSYWQGIDYSFPEDDTIVSKRVAVW